jgi:hypothetical protein
MSGGWLGRTAILLLVGTPVVLDDTFKRSADESFTSPPPNGANQAGR